MIAPIGQDNTVKCGRGETGHKAQVQILGFESFRRKNGDTYRIGYIRIPSVGVTSGQELEKIVRPVQPLLP